MADEQGEMEPVFEYERRFLVSDPTVTRGAFYEHISQAYVFGTEGYAIRVRLIRPNDRPDADEVEVATLTAKGPRFGGQREEYEMRVTPLWARQVISRSDHVIKKRRYQILGGGTDSWEVDEFLDRNAGLWIAELEGASPVRPASLPPWVGREVTADSDYDNDALAFRPFDSWPIGGTEVESEDA